MNLYHYHLQFEGMSTTYVIINILLPKVHVCLYAFPRYCCLVGSLLRPHTSTAEESLFFLTPCSSQS